MTFWTYTLYTYTSRIISLHMSNIPNKLVWYSEHTPCIPMLQESSVHARQTPQINWYDIPNIQPVYICFRNWWFTHPNKLVWYSEHTPYIPMLQKWLVCTCHPQINWYDILNIHLYTYTSGIISSRMPNVPNELVWYSEHIPCIPMLQESLVRTCQTSQIN
jgi:hypothetical protein